MWISRDGKCWLSPSTFIQMLMHLFLSQTCMEHDPSQALQVSIVVKGRGMNPHGQLWGKTFPGWEYRMPRGLDGLSGATERGVEVEERKCQLMVCEFFIALVLLSLASACTVCPSYPPQEWCWAEPSSISPQCGVVHLVKVSGHCPSPVRKDTIEEGCRGKDEYL